MNPASSRALLLLLLLSSPSSSLAADPAPSAVLGWYEDLFSAADRDGDRVQIRARASWFALPEPERQAMLREALSTWDRTAGRPAGASMVEVADGGRGSVYRWDGSSIVALTSWDLTRRLAQPDPAMAQFQGERRFFLNLSGRSRLSESLTSTNLSARWGMFLYKGQYDASVGLDITSTKTDIDFGDSTSSPSTATAQTWNAMFRRHFQLKDQKNISPNAGAQVSVPDGDADPQILGVFGAGIRASEKGFGLIDVTVSIGEDSRTFNVGYTYLIF